MNKTLSSSTECKCHCHPWNQLCCVDNPDCYDEQRRYAPKEEHKRCQHCQPDTSTQGDDSMKEQIIQIIIDRNMGKDNYAFESADKLLALFKSERTKAKEEERQEMIDYEKTTGECYFYAKEKEGFLTPQGGRLVYTGSGTSTGSGTANIQFKQDSLNREGKDES